MFSFSSKTLIQLSQNFWKLYFWSQVNQGLPRDPIRGPWWALDPRFWEFFFAPASHSTLLYFASPQPPTSDPHFHNWVTSPALLRVAASLKKNPYDFFYVAWILRKCLKPRCSLLSLVFYSHCKTYPSSKQRSMFQTSKVPNDPGERLDLLLLLAPIS